MRVELVRCGPAVNESERKAANRLKTGLISQPGDSRWFLFTNLLFSATPERQPDEIDIVVAGPQGVRVVEVKHWTAYWAKRHPEIVEQEADRVTRKARRLGTTLRRSVPELPFVDGVFLVTEAAGKVRALRERGPVRGVPFFTLSSWRELLDFESPPALSDGKLRVLAHQLSRRQMSVHDAHLRQVAGYSDLKPLSPPKETFHRAFKGVHVSRKERVILHLYDLSAEGGSAAAAERHWQLLHGLQEHRWAPRVVDSLQDVPGHDGEVQFFTVADSEEPSLRERARDDDWTPQARIRFAGKAVEALSEVQAAVGAGELVEHMALASGTILIRHDDSPIFTGLPDRHPGRGAKPDAGGDAGTDSQALLEVLRGLFEGREDRASRTALEILARRRSDARSGSASLEEVRDSLVQLAEEPPGERRPRTVDSWTEGQEVDFRGRRFRIVSRLGREARIVSFRLVELDRATGAELAVHVGKAASEEAAGHALREAHLRARSLPTHPGLGAVAEVASEWKPDEFVAVLPWIDGVPLGDYDGVLPILAEDLGDRSAEALVLRWLRTVCQALGAMHRNGLVHRHVNARNLIVAEHDLVLTGFDRVARVGPRQESRETGHPDTPNERGSRPSDDFRDLAASFFEVLWQKGPFLHDGVDRPERGLAWEGVDADGDSLVTRFLRRASDPDASRRFGSAEEALRALTLGDDQPAALPKRRTPNRVRWLRKLLESYAGSRWGNRETRGLDSDFAARTYVETKMERSLERAILERRARLLVLCGNAGDGKTALLQRLAKRLGLEEARSADRVVEGTLPDGGTIRMNFDGSAAWGGRSANELLDEFLGPFQDGPPAEDLVHLVAVNDGRLLEWMETEAEETPLVAALKEAVDGSAAPAATHVRFVNLNDRSLVGSTAPDRAEVDTRFLDQLVDALYGGDSAEDTWSPCRTCTAQERCEVFRAAGVFGPAGLAPNAVRKRARRRLFEALQAVHLRGETHITMRELRGALVYILFGTDYCDDYHKGDRSPGPWPRFGERTFSPGSGARQGEVLAELVRFDPALESDARLDRALWRTHLARPAAAGSIRPDREQLGQVRRWAYFESEGRDGETRPLPDRGSIPLAGGKNLAEFRALATGGDVEGLAKRLCAGISRLQALPAQALDREGVVPLPISPRTPTETAFWVEKSLAAFRVEPVLPPSSVGDGRLHRRARLIYRGDDEREEVLHLGADLFHLLLELSEGYQLGDVATDGTFAHLSIFVQRLAKQDERTIFAWNPMREDTVFRVSAILEGGNEELQQKLRIAPTG